jgi:hypothetical protein
MESENIINTLAIYLLANKYLVIRIVQFFAAHDAHTFQVIAIFNELTEAD